VFTLSFNRLPGCPSRSCAHPSARLPERGPVRDRTIHRQVSFAMDDLRVSVSRIHEARFAAGLPAMKRAPHMVPEAMQPSPIHTRRHSSEGRPRTARFGHAILERPHDLVVAHAIARLSLRKSFVW